MAVGRAHLQGSARAPLNMLVHLACHRLGAELALAEYQDFL
jgi:hypothetical protein